MIPFECQFGCDRIRKNTLLPGGRPQLVSLVPSESRGRSGRLKECRQAQPPFLADLEARLRARGRTVAEVMAKQRAFYELAESGRGLTAQTLSEWVQTGHQHYLQQRQSIESAKTKAEFAADLVREFGHIEPSVIHRACMSIVAIQIFHAIMEHGDKALVDMLRAKPASYIAILNALCNLTNTTLKLEDHRVPA